MAALFFFLLLFIYLFIYLFFADIEYPQVCFPTLTSLIGKALLVVSESSPDADLDVFRPLATLMTALRKSGGYNYFPRSNKKQACGKRLLTTYLYFFSFMIVFRF